MAKAYRLLALCSRALAAVIPRTDQRRTQSTARHRGVGDGRPSGLGRRLAEMHAGVPEAAAAAVAATTATAE